MEETNKVINTRSPLYEEFAIDVDADSLFEVSDSQSGFYSTSTTTCTPSPSKCCLSAEEVDFEKCEDFCKHITARPEVCGGKILRVNVTLKKVCCPSTVTVAVAVLDKRTKKLIALKVDDIVLGPGSDNRHCVQNVDAGEFCFAFTDECKDDEFEVKIIANYKLNKNC